MTRIPNADRAELEELTDEIRFPEAGRGDDYAGACQQ